MAVDADSKKVISTFDKRLSQKENCENFNAKFKVPALEQCAIALKTETKDEDGKKLFVRNKAGLVNEIVTKIKSCLPRTCGNCEVEYSTNLGEDPLFVCDKCGAPSHNCEDLAKIRDIFPNSLPKGIIWVCGECDATPYQNIGSKIKEVDANEKQKQPEQTTNITKIKQRNQEQHVFIYF